MTDQFARTRLMFGPNALAVLAHKRVALFGIGGVGGYVAEALTRTGIGALDIIDSDSVCLSNLNRQIIATHSTLGSLKTEAMKQRLSDINPACQVIDHACFYLPETADQFDLESYDYVIDAVDTVTAKIHLIMQAQAAHTPIISAMGAGNKTDPTAIRIADIYDTSVCPLARIMRKELRKRNVKALKVAYSTESPLKPFEASEEEEPFCQHGESELSTGSKRRSTPSSNAFVPAAMGLALAAEVTKDLIADYWRA